MKFITLLVFTAMTALAGPPLICERIQIGDAKSLPWKNVNGWNGADPSYNVASLTADTLAILTPNAPLPLRMETLRRAAIYAAKTDGGEPVDIQSARACRGLGSKGKPSANVWFDAGYFVETLRQAAFVYRYDMLSPAEKTQWRVRGEVASLDGKPWIEKAISLGGKGMEVPLAKAEEFRRADMQRVNALVTPK